MVTSMVSLQVNFAPNLAVASHLCPSQMYSTYSSNTPNTQSLLLDIRMIPPSLLLKSVTLLYDQDLWLIQQIYFLGNHFPRIYVKLMDDILFQYVCSDGCMIIPLLASWLNTPCFTFNFLTTTVYHSFVKLSIYLSIHPSIYLSVQYRVLHIQKITYTYVQIHLPFCFHHIYIHCICIYIYIIHLQMDLPL